MVRHAFKLVSEGFKITHRTSEKAPGATNTEGLSTDTTNGLNVATCTRHSKAVATQIAEFAIQGHVVHELKDGGFLVCGCRHTFHAIDIAALQACAHRMGVRR